MSDSSPLPLRQSGLDPQGRKAGNQRQPGLDPGQGFSSSANPETAHPEPVEGVEGPLPSIQGMIFSTPMVKALWEGRKGQTRRLLPDGRLPRLNVGDRVYVRETFRIAPDAAEGWPHEAEPCPGWIEYAAGGSHYCFAPAYFAVLKALGRKPIDWDALPQTWRPSRIAPRWTSRMFLTITDVRVQLLHEIDEEDAKAEGLEQCQNDVAHGFDRWECRTLYRGAEFLPWITDACEAYADLWDHLNTRPGTCWGDNPRIVAYTFTVTRRNIDVLPMAPGYFAESTPRQPVPDRGQGFSFCAQPNPAHPEPVEGRALIEGNVPPHIAAQLIRASDLPQPERKS